MARTAKLPKKTNPQKTWGIHQMRLTAFTAVPVQMNEKIFFDLTKVKPTDARLLPQVSITGPLSPGLITVNAALDRVDFYIRPKAIEGDGPPLLETMGSIADVFETLGPIANRFFSSKRLIRRLAFGAVFYQPAADQPDATRILRQYLHDLRFAANDDVRDLFFQINRPRSSKTRGSPKGLIINRLSKWSITEVRQAQVPLDQVRVILSGAGRFAAQLEIDINSNPDLKAIISPTLAKALLREFVTLGDEISNKGDTK